MCSLFILVEITLNKVAVKFVIVGNSLFVGRYDQTRLILTNTKDFRGKELQSMVRPISINLCEQFLG